MVSRKEVEEAESKIKRRKLSKKDLDALKKG